MSVLMPFLALDQTCEQVLEWVNQQVDSAGFRAVQTFDLQVARLAHPDCPCPHHGTNDCNCQMIVLLIYGNQGDPATLVIHGQDGRAWLSLIGPKGKQSNQHLEAAIRRVLLPRLFNKPSSTEVAYEVQSTG